MHSRTHFHSSNRRLRPRAWLGSSPERPDYSTQHLLFNVIPHSDLRNFGPLLSASERPVTD